VRTLATERWRCRSRTRTCAVWRACCPPASPRSCAAAASKPCGRRPLTAGSPACASRSWCSARGTAAGFPGRLPVPGRLHPGAELAPLEKGGGMAAWSGGAWFANKLLSSSATRRKARKNAAERHGERAAAGLDDRPLHPAHWGLQAGLGLVRLEPGFVRQVLPPLLGSSCPCCGSCRRADSTPSPSCASGPSAPAACCCPR